MMRFPLRLTADLAMARFARRSHLALDSKPVQFVDAAEILHHDSDHPVSHEKIREIISSRSPVVWIGGSEPLHHPGVSHLVRAIAGSGHFVFLETDGTLLRRRIHEFQPVSRLFLTVRMESGGQRQTSKTLRANSLELAAEGIHAARLSGFLICVHARVRVETELGEMAELIQFARALDVDGIVISPANGGSSSANADAVTLQRQTAEARMLIGSKWWESFSRLIEPVVSSDRQEARNTEETAVRVEQEAHSNEGSVRVA
jgi:molybdenum cofactor biosynthesis enzyme MoaA